MLKFNFILSVKKIAYVFSPVLTNFVAFTLYFKTKLTLFSLHYSATLGYKTNTLAGGRKDLKLQKEHNLSYATIQMRVENRGSLVQFYNCSALNN
jgi:hypothetical protein